MILFVIARASEDCADEFTRACDEDITEALYNLAAASQHITDAISDCGDGEPPSDCAVDINALLVNIADASSASMDASFDCSEDAKKCAEDVEKASAAITKGIQDSKAVIKDCKQ